MFLKLDSSSSRARANVTMYMFFRPSSKKQILGLISSLGLTLYYAGTAVSRVAKKFELDSYKLNLSSINRKLGSFIK
jgi:hypothetical protein